MSTSIFGKGRVERIYKQHSYVCSPRQNCKSKTSGLVFELHDYCSRTYSCVLTIREQMLMERSEP